MAACGPARTADVGRIGLIDDGSVAMLKGVEADCEHVVLTKPEHCGWSRPLDTRIERTAQARVVVAADGTPTSAVDLEGEDEAVRACAMALRFASGGGECTVRLHLARYVTDVAPARRLDPSTDCSGAVWGGAGAGCASVVGPAPLR